MTASDVMPGRYHDALIRGAELEFGGAKGAVQ